MLEIALHLLAGAGAHPGVVHLHRIIEPALPTEDGTLSLPSPYTFLVMDYTSRGVYLLIATLWASSARISNLKTSSAGAAA